jgi:phosphatidylserine/phosphatidylglycerophosphate/cardiolipin synthase-like enzyme
LNVLPTRTPAQRVVLLLGNVAREERGEILLALAGEHEQPQAEVAAHVTQACRRALSECSETQRAAVLTLAGEMADLLEDQQRASNDRETTIKIVGTLPAFLYLTQQYPAPPISRGSLHNELVRMVRTAKHTIDIVIPYVSRSGVDIFTRGLQPGSLQGLKVRILTLLTGKHIEQNVQGVRRLVARYERAGAQVEVRSPTDKEAQMSGAIAVMHAKAIIVDQRIAYLGTANISLAALMRGFELGTIITGPPVEQLWELLDWVYTRHQLWVPPQRPRQEEVQRRH